MTIHESGPEFGHRLLWAVAETIYPAYYPRQSTVIDISERKLGSQAYICDCARRILLGARIHEGALDEYNIAEAIYEERWPHFSAKRPFGYISEHEQREFLDIAHAIIDCILSGGHDA